ncbi:glycosyltransferase [Modestobacter sp. SYSU DS0657]
MITQPGTTSSGAVRVVLVDVGDPLPVLDARRPDGSSWAGVWLVVRVAGEPVAVVERAFDEHGVLSAADVERAVSTAVRDARPRSMPPLPDAALPPATVVVASDLARPDQLRRCLTALTRLDYPDFEVVVVDNHRGAERDGLLDEVLVGLDGVRAVREAVPGTSAARNAGARAARGEVVAFTDDDVRVDPGWLRAIGTRFTLRPEEGLVTGLILPADLETDAQLWFERHYGGFGGQRVFAPMSYRGAGRRCSPVRRSQVAAVDWTGAEQRRFAVYGAGVCGAGANMAFRASVLRDIGGFDPSLGPGTPARGGEDLALFITHLWRGGAIGYEPAAMVFHSHRADYDGLRRQLFDYGRGFTALLTALLLADPLHLVGIASRLPAYVRQARSAGGHGGSEAAPVEPADRLGSPVPGELATLESRGALRGPAAYLHSRVTERRRRRLATRS